jgi:hypothetical protein
MKRGPTLPSAAGGAEAPPNCLGSDRAPTVIARAGPLVTPGPPKEGFTNLSPKRREAAAASASLIGMSARMSPSALSKVGTRLFSYIPRSGSAM